MVKARRLAVVDAQVCYHPHVVSCVPTLPADVARLLTARIESVSDLEVLLLLHEIPSTEWTAEQVARATGLDVARTRQLLLRLSQRQLIVAHRGGPQLAFSYVDQAPELAQTLRHVAALYVEQRPVLTRLIAGKSSG